MNNKSLFNKISKILIEITFLILGICLATIIVGVAFNNINSRSQYESFPGIVNKKELVIASPSFAIIEKIDVYEGKLIKKNDELAKLKIVVESKNRSELDAYVNNENFKLDGDILTVYSPADGIVGKVFFAEKSNVKPEIDIISIYPFQSSSVTFFDKNNKFIPGDYKNILAQKQDSDVEKFQLNLLNTYPVDSSTNGGKSFYAAFSDPEAPKHFENNGVVTVLAEKRSRPNNLFTFISNLLILASNKIVSIFQK